MAFKKRGGGNDKYLRLTGLWQSKNNDALWTGRLKQEQVEDLLKKVEEANEAEAPIVFSLWENKDREGKRDPEFSLQCFVGDKEEEGGSSRSSRSSRKSSGSSRSSRDNAREEDMDSKRKGKGKDEDEDGDTEDTDDNEDNQENGDEEERPKSRKGSSSKTGKSSKRSSTW